jgi:hypothetical protein
MVSTENTVYNTGKIYYSTEPIPAVYVSSIEGVTETRYYKDKLIEEYQFLPTDSNSYRPDPLEYLRPDITYSAIFGWEDTDPPRLRQIFIRDNKHIIEFAKIR